MTLDVIQTSKNREREGERHRAHHHHQNARCIRFLPIKYSSIYCSTPMKIPIDWNNGLMRACACACANLLVNKRWRPTIKLYVFELLSIGAWARCAGAYSFALPLSLRLYAIRMNIMSMSTFWNSETSFRITVSTNRPTFASHTYSLANTMYKNVLERSDRASAPGLSNPFGINSFVSMCVCVSIEPILVLSSSSSSNQTEFKKKNPPSMQMFNVQNCLNKMYLSLHMCRGTVGHCLYLLNIYRFGDWSRSDKSVKRSQYNYFIL